MLANLNTTGKTQFSFTKELTWFFFTYPLMTNKKAKNSENEVVAEQLQPHRLFDDMLK